MFLVQLSLHPPLKVCDVIYGRNLFNSFDFLCLEGKSEYRAFALLRLDDYRPIQSCGDLFANTQSDTVAALVH